MTEEKLEAWASDPSQWGKPQGVLTGPEAAEFACHLLGAQPGEIEDLERRRAGRPRLDGTRQKNPNRSPRVNVAITPAQRAGVDALARRRKVRPSTIVREALDEYILSHSV